MRYLQCLPNENQHNTISVANRLITRPLGSHLQLLLSQNVTNKSCLACDKSEKYLVWVTLRPLRFMKQGETELRILQYWVR